MFESSKSSLSEIIYYFVIYYKWYIKKKLLFIANVVLL